MTEQEAKIVILEDALRQAQNTVEFLHMCLVKPSNGEMNGGYRYGYPESTLELLQEWKILASRVCEFVKPCYHSHMTKDCESCQLSYRERIQLFEARKVLEELEKC